jgi:hypothetical protein
MSTPANNPAQIHIFIDLDGVLADFDRHARAHGKYDASGNVKWEELDYQWWVTMPACAGAKVFYDAAKKLGIVKFLTAPVKSEECFSGKAHWIQDFVPERGKFALMDLIICPSADKGYLAAANRILIDDRQNNIQDWINAGGIGIHHTGDFKETMQKLQDALAKLPAPKKNTKPNPPGPKS